MNIITVHNDSFTSVSPPEPKGASPALHAMSRTKQVLSKYPEIFNYFLGTLAGEVHQEVNTEVRPVITPFGRIPAALGLKFKDEIDRLHNLSVITRSVSLQHGLTAHQLQLRSPEVLEFALIPALSTHQSSKSGTRWLF